MSGVVAAVGCGGEGPWGWVCACGVRASARAACGVDRAACGHAACARSRRSRGSSYASPRHPPVGYPFGAALTLAPGASVRAAGTLHRAEGIHEGMETNRATMRTKRLSRPSPRHLPSSSAGNLVLPIAPARDTQSSLRARVPRRGWNILGLSAPPLQGCPGMSNSMAPPHCETSRCGGTL